MNKLYIHHVGGRSGSRSFPVTQFEEDIVNIMYDADPSCVEQIQNYWKGEKSETIVHPKCLFSHQGKKTFHLNYDPYTSSIYPFNPRYKDWYYPSHFYDYVMGEACKEVKTLTLDIDVIKGRCDFISLDTQGSELDILEGMTEEPLGILLEVEFHRLYKYQPLFGDICKYLKNFDLVDIEILDRLRPIRGKLRGKGYTTHGEALFLRKPETVEGLDVNKLAFFAVIFNQFELAEQCFEKMTYRHGRKYLQFTNKLSHLLKSVPRTKRKTFSQVYSEKQSHDRFISRPQVTGLVKNIVDVMHSVEGARETYNQWKKKVIILIKLNGIGLAPVERLFLQYGLKDQCKLMLENACL